MPGHIPLPAETPVQNTSYQVTPPSVVLPTPILPPLRGFTNATPEASPTPDTNQTAVPQPTPEQVFTPPSAARLNLPSAQSSGSTVASLGMPSMRLDDASSGPGPLGEIFDWAKKLRFDAGVRVGYDNNVNDGGGVKTTEVTIPITHQVITPAGVPTLVHTNAVFKQTNGAAAIASPFVNLNGGVAYRFGDPRLKVKVDLAGGVSRYLDSKISQPLQGTVGLGVGVDYRYNPRMVFTFNSSTSYQQQPNITLAGTANSSNNPYYYSANSLAAAYEWSRLLTTVTRFNFSGSYYPGGNSSGQGFSQPGITQSFRYLVKPTTTAVMDCNADYYGYGNNGNSSTGVSALVGFDHIFNPMWFWNFRVGAEIRDSQNASAGNSTYFGPSMNSTFSWVFAKRSSLSWVANLGTQPSGQNRNSYSVALSSGLNFAQGLFTKMTFNAGIYYLLNEYPNVAIAGNPSTSYNQNNVQANASLAYELNRIINLSLGYQYITTTSSSSSLAQDYNRGITYFQISAGL